MDLESKLNNQTLKALAEANDITLLQRLSEKEAAKILGFSVQTLRRKRSKGEIDCLKVSERNVRYFGYQICEYILSQLN